MNAEVRMHNGRPTIFVEGKPLAFAAFSPVRGSGWLLEKFEKSSRRFFAHDLTVYLLTPPAG